MRISGSTAIMQSLVHEGVDVIFGYPGGAIMPVYDALYHFRNQIRHILVRHEQGAVHAAEGYARISGRPGVCMATSGPGATNLVTGIADAMLDSIPLVCITGQVASSLLGTDAFQETDVVGITIPITKWNHQVRRAQDIPGVLAKAFYIASTGRPGPVVIDITKDAQLNFLEWEYKPLTEHKTYVSRYKLENKSLEKAAELISKSKKPMILAGHGVLIARASEELVKFAEKHQIPVCTTLHGLSCISRKHPLNKGMLGMHGNYGPNVLTNEADLIIAVGMRFDDRVTGDLKSYAVKAKIIHIDIDPVEINKNVPVAVSLLADAKEALKALRDMVPVTGNKRTEWFAEFDRCQRYEEEKVLKDALAPVGDKVKMAEVVRMVSDETNGEAFVIADVGQHQMMAARYYHFTHPESYVTSGGLGTMGFALPAAVGAQVAVDTTREAIKQNRTVVAFIGDGGFQMTMQELGTIAQENLPIKIVILNNNFLGMVRQWQELFFEHRYSFVDISGPNFVMLGESFGIKSRRVKERADLPVAIKEMLAHEGPYLLEVVVEQEENVFPMVPSGCSVSDIRLE